MDREGLTGIEEVLFTRPVPLDGERDVPSKGEHCNDTNPNVPTRHIPLIQEAIVQADRNVICHRRNPRRSNSVIRADVRDNAELTPNGHAGEEELLEQGSERPSDEPVLDRMEHKLVASVSIFLPSRKLVIHRE